MVFVNSWVTKLYVQAGQIVTAYQNILVFAIWKSLFVSDLTMTGDKDFA